MLSDCEAGKIDIILTKSISRFARNTVDLLETVLHLKSIGVEIRFEKENINSFSEDGELILSLLASFAQEENLSISENCKWGVRKRFQSGEIGAANKHILGYRYDDEQKKYIIIPEEAVIVRRMFSLYLEGKSLQAICDELNDTGYRTINGCLFQEVSLALLIKNEIYAGDLRRQKSYMADPFKRTKVKNRGDESVPSLIQSNGIEHGNPPRNKAFSSQAAHGSLFLLPGGQGNGGRRRVQRTEKCIPH